MKQFNIDILKNDLMALDFEFLIYSSIVLKPNKLAELIQQPWAVSEDGKIYLNTAHEGYEYVKKVFVYLNDIPTEELEQFIQWLNDKYSDVKDFNDYSRYTSDDDRINVIFKLLIPSELEKRKHGKNNIQKSLIFMTNI
jgi:hypothetical protein